MKAVKFCGTHVNRLSVSEKRHCFLSVCRCPPSSDLAQIEENAGQRLLDMEQEKMQREKELESLEEQLRQCTAKSQITDSELQYPFFIGVCLS